MIVLKNVKSMKIDMNRNHRTYVSGVLSINLKVDPVMLKFQNGNQSSKNVKKENYADISKDSKLNIELENQDQFPDYD